MDKRIGFVAAWLVAAVLAVTLGLLAVNTVGASIRGRGLLGSEVTTDATDPAPGSTPGSTPGENSAAPGVRRTVSGEWGEFVVECRETYAYGVAVRPDRATGWRTVSYEKGPDDDVDAVFSNGRNSVDLEVFCNRGRPTVAEVERNTLADD